MTSVKVLVVEDGCLVRLVAVEALRDAGWTVVEAESADEALRIISSARGAYDAVFSDIEMPGELDGLELARAVRRIWPTVTVVLTSGRVRPLPAELPPGSQFLSKPYMFEAVVALIAATGSTAKG